MAKKTSSAYSKRKKEAAQKHKEKSSTPGEEKKIFQPINYILMIVGAVVIGVGYLLMTGGGQAPAEFNYDEIYSFRRITLAPVVILLGFVITVVAILWKPKTALDNASENV